VSAAGNVVAVNSDFDRVNIIPALNSRLDSIVFYGIAEVGDDFNPRHAKQRWYRYVLPCDPHTSKKRLEEVSQNFMGERDFRALSKKDTGEENTILEIDSIIIQESGDIVLIDVRARRFLWQMVRRLVSAMLKEDDSSGIGPMPAENLVLMDVVYDFGFEIVEKDTLFTEREIQAKIRAETMKQIGDFIASA
jgi:tRNA pseudouridine38-40 synthase